MQRRISRWCRFCGRNHVNETFDTSRSSYWEFPSWQIQNHSGDEMIFNERAYQSWNVDEMAHWVRSKLTSLYPSHNTPQHSFVCGVNHSHVVQRTIATMRTQYIDGASLEFLTLQHMISFDIPFGMAVHLKAAFDDLCNSSERSGYETNRNRLQSNMAVLPSWYEESKTNDSDSNHHEFDIEMQENVQKIMGDRFGMTLPTLRGNLSNNETTHKLRSDVESIRNNLEPKELAQILQMNLNEDDPKTSPPTPDSNPSSFGDMLQNMPPYVRSIAERRPDLVSKLLSEMQLNHKNPGHSLNTISELEDSSEECNIIDEVNYDSEYVGLLRRRGRS